MKLVSLRTKNRIYDRVQRIWVCTCLAVSAVAALNLGWNAFNYFVYIRPLKKEMEENFKEELLREGRLALEQKSTLQN